MDVLFFSVYDAAVSRHLDPFTAPTDEAAVRGFRQAVLKDGHPFNLNPEDYTLFHLGAFDPEDGSIIPAVAARKVVSGLEMKRSDD